MRPLLLLIVTFQLASSQFLSPSIIIERVRHDSTTYEFDAEIPVARAENAGALNKFMAAYIHSLESDFADGLRDYDPSIPPRPGDKSGLYVRVTHGYAEHGFVSYWLTIESALAGSVHPSRRYATINYDMTRERILTARDIFQSPDSVILGAIMQKLRESQNPCFVDVQLDTNLVGQLNFVFDKNNVLFVFPDDQLASHGCGPFEAQVPRKKLRLRLPR